jgi:hypothetical protein
MTGLLRAAGAACLATALAGAACAGFDGWDCGDGIDPGANGRQTDAPSVRAHRLDGGDAIVVDGRLDEPAWRDAQAACGFSMWDPDRGEPPSEETVFKVAYDEEAIYFGIACFEADCSNIRTKLCRRDRISDSDVISLYLDTYHDHTTGYNFRVNTLGVQEDRYVFNDGNMDRDWDAVWEGGAHRDEDGWYAELRIPFSCVRFRPAEDMTWGCQLYRFLYSRGEDTSWVTWDRETRGFVSRFGEITGLSGVEAPRQLELMPYVVQRTTDPSVTGPEEMDHFQNVGLDVKYGVTADLTLNATIQPDFGQVEADPAVLNLSPFETYYEEKRPFFVEGNRFFSHPTFNAFHSRRIGTGDPNSRIRVAGKLTGKTPGGLSLAGLYALTDITEEGRAHQLFTAGEQESHYFVARLGQEFREGTHRVNVMQTAVLRSADRDEHGNYASRDAFTTGVDFDLNFRDRDYNIQGTFVGSTVDPAPLESDPAVAHGPYYGTGGTLELRKLGGSVRGGIEGRWETDDLDLNDVGFLSAPDEIVAGGWLQWQHHPEADEGIFNAANVNVNVWRSWLYGSGEGRDPESGEPVWSYGRGHPRSFDASIGGWGQFRNYWSVWAGFGGDTEGTSKYETRYFDGERGPLMTTAQSFWYWWGFHSDYRKALNFSSEGNYSWNDRGGTGLWLEVEGGWNATEAMTYYLSVGYSRSHSDAAHLDAWRIDEDADWNHPNPGGGIGGVSYLFAERDRRTVDATFRADILFSRDLSLQLYAQPYLTVGDYRNPRELVRPDSYDLAPAEDVPGFEPEDVHKFDFRYSAVNINAVLRWEYAPASTFYLVWKQGREIGESRSDTPGFSTALDADALFDNEPENTFLAKVTYWFSL